MCDAQIEMATHGLSPYAFIHVYRVCKSLANAADTWRSIYSFPVIYLYTRRRSFLSPFLSSYLILFPLKLCSAKLFSVEQQRREYSIYITFKTLTRFISLCFCMDNLTLPFYTSQQLFFYFFHRVRVFF